MPSDRTISPQGLEALKQREGGFYAEPYDDAGGLAIGYGMNRWKGQKVEKGLRITQEEADEEFEQQVRNIYAPVVARALQVPVTQSQFDALVSVAYNLPAAALSIVRKLNAGQTPTAMDFQRHVTSEGRRHPGLVARRKDEYLSFKRPDQPPGPGEKATEVTPRAALPPLAAVPPTVPGRPPPMEARGYTDPASVKVTPAPTAPVAETGQVRPGTAAQRIGQVQALATTQAPGWQVPREQRPPPRSAEGITNPPSVQGGTPPAEPTPVTFDELIRTEAKKAGVPPELALAIADKTDFNLENIMQVAPETATQYDVDATQPIGNVQGGVRHLRHLLEKYNGNAAKTLAAYTAGEEALDQAPGIADVPDAQAYVTDVLQRFETYAEQMATPAAAAPAPATVPAAPAAPGGRGFPPGTTRPATPASGRGAGPGFAGYRPETAAQGVGAPYQPPAGEPSPLSQDPFQRFVLGAGRELLVEPVKAAWAIGQRLYQESTPEAVAKLTPQERFARGLPGGVLAPMVRDLFQGTVKSHWDEGVKAYQAYKEGRWTDTMLHGGGTVIPFLGPYSASIIEEGQRTGDYATAIGRLGGVFAPTLLKGFGIVRGTKPVGEIPFTFGERTGSSWALFWERLTERTLPGSPAFQKFRLSQQLALQEKANRVVDSLRSLQGRLPGGPRSRADIGTLVGRGLEDTRESIQATLKTMYGAIDDKVRTSTIRVPKYTEEPSLIVGPRGEPLTVTKRTLVKEVVGPAFASTADLKKTAIPMLRRIQAEAQLIPPAELARTTEILTRIVKSPKRLPFQVYQDSRSDLLKIVRSHGDLLPGKAAGVAKRFVEETDNAMIEAARSSGIPGLEAEVRAANQFRADAEIFNDKFIKRLVQDVSAENVSAVLSHADVVEIDAVRNLLQQTSPAAWKNARARVMQDLLEEATQGELVSGAQQAGNVLTQGQLPTAITGQLPAATQPTLVVTKLERAMENLGVERLHAIFGPQATNDLLAVITEGKRISPQSKFQAHGLIMAGINGTILSPLISPFTGLKTLPVSAALTTTFYGLAHVMTHPEGLKTYRRFAQAVSSGNRPLALTLGLQLTRQVAEEEANRPKSQVSAPATAAAPAAP